MKRLVADGKVVENWKRFKQNFALSITLTEYTKKPDPLKTSLLL